MWGMQTAAARVAAALLLISMNEGGVALNRLVDGEWEEEGVGKATWANFRIAYEETYEKKMFATALRCKSSHKNFLILGILLFCVHMSVSTIVLHAFCVLVFLRLVLMECFRLIIKRRCRICHISYINF